MNVTYSSHCGHLALGVWKYKEGDTLLNILWELHFIDDFSPFVKTEIKTEAL